MAITTDRRCFLLHGNRFAEAAVAGGHWALPVDNLGISNLYQDVARCGTGVLADAVYTLTWPKVMTVGGLSLVGYTGPAAGKIRLTWRRAGVVVGAPAWESIRPVIGRTADLSYDDDNFWTGRGDGPYFFIPAERLRADALTVEIDARGAAFDLSYMFVADFLRPAWPMDWGRKLKPDSRVKIAKTLGGMIIPGPRLTPQRRQTIAFQELTKTEASRFLDLAMRQDVVDPLLFVADPGDPVNWGREVWLARLTDLPEYEEVSPDRYRLTMTIEEIVA